MPRVLTIIIFPLRLSCQPSFSLRAFFQNVLIECFLASFLVLTGSGLSVGNSLIIGNTFLKTVTVPMKKKTIQQDSEEDLLILRATGSLPGE